MALDRLNNTRFHNDVEQSNRSSKEQLEFCYANKNLVAKMRKGADTWQKIVTFRQMIKQGELLTPNQKNLIENIYEKVWDKAGFPAYSNPKHDIKKNIKY